MNWAVDDRTHMPNLLEIIWSTDSLHFGETFRAPTKAANFTADIANVTLEEVQWLTAHFPPS
tara:strand:+ start:4288 stop:4473 length:186 start_codon:yes stop_codon:yes gene_type:complete